MRVANRLFLTVLPAGVALIFLAVLAYWGQYAYHVPEAFALIAGIGALASCVLAWWNARHIGQRIERLASTQRTPPGRGRPALGDELSMIEHDVEALGLALSEARAEAARLRLRSDEARRDAAEILAKGAESTGAAVESIRMPLHILLENRFGDLNENQEEMLGAAQAAAEEAAAVVSRLRLLSDLELAKVIPRDDPVRLDEVLRTLVPQLRVEAERRGVEITIELEAVVPKVNTDRSFLRDLIILLMRAAIGESAAPGKLQVAVRADGGEVSLLINGERTGEGSLDGLIAGRIAAALGARLDHRHGAVVLTFAAGRAPPRI